MTERKKLTDEAFMLVLIETLGGIRMTAATLGWAWVMDALAPPDADRAWYLSHGPFSQATRYRHVRALERVKEALLEQGYELEEDTPPAAAVGWRGLWRRLRAAS